MKHAMVANKKRFQAAVHSKTGTAFCIEVHFERRHRGPRWMMVLRFFPFVTPATNQGLNSSRNFAESNFIPRCNQLLDSLRLPNPSMTSIQTDITQQLQMRCIRRILLAVPQCKPEECPNVTWPEGLTARDPASLEDSTRVISHCTPDFSHSPR